MYTSELCLYVLSVGVFLTLSLIAHTKDLFNIQHLFIVNAGTIHSFYFLQSQTNKEPTHVHLKTILERQ